MVSEIVHQNIYLIILNKRWIQLQYEHIEGYLLTIKFINTVETKANAWYRSRAQSIQS